MKRERKSEQERERKGKAVGKTIIFLFFLHKVQKNCTTLTLLRFYLDNIEIGKIKYS